MPEPVSRRGHWQILADSAHPLLLAPPNLFTFRHPCSFEPILYTATTGLAEINLILVGYDFCGLYKCFYKSFPTELAMSNPLRVLKLTGFSLNELEKGIIFEAKK